MPQEPIFNVPDVFNKYSPDELARMVQAMAGLAALGGTSRQVTVLELTKRIPITELVAKEALEGLVACGFALHHTSNGTPDLNSYRIYA